MADRAICLGRKERTHNVMDDRRCVSCSREIHQFLYSDLQPRSYNPVVRNCPPPPIMTLTINGLISAADVVSEQNTSLSIIISRRTINGVGLSQSVYGVLLPQSDQKPAENPSGKTDHIVYSEY